MKRTVYKWNSYLLMPLLNCLSKKPNFISQSVFLFTRSSIRPCIHPSGPPLRGRGPRRASTSLTFCPRSSWGASQGLMEPQLSSEGLSYRISLSLSLSLWVIVIGVLNHIRILICPYKDISTYLSLKRGKEFIGMNSFIQSYIWIHLNVILESGRTYSVVISS